MLKKKYLFMFLLILLLGLSGQCYAVVNMVPSDFNKSDIDVFEFLVTNTYGDIDLDEPSVWQSATHYNNFQSALNVLYGSSYTGFTDRGFTNRIYVVCSLTNIIYSYNGQHTAVNLQGQTKAYDFYISSDSSGKLGFYGSTPVEYKNYSSTINGSATDHYVFAYTTDGWYELDQGSVNLDDIITPPTFDPNGDELSYQQWGNPINNITSSYIASNVNLGQWVEGYENGSDYRYNLVEIRPATTGYDYSVTGLVATQNDYLSISQNYHYVTVPMRVLKLGSFYILSINYYLGSTLKNDNYFYYINGSSTGNGQLNLYSR